MTPPATAIKNGVLAGEGPTARPATYHEVLQSLDKRVARNSAKGRGMRLEPEEVRALDWAVLRADGGADTERWLEGSFEQIEGRDHAR